MAARLQQFVSQLSGSSAVSKLEAKHPDDVVIVLAIRSPLCRARTGGFKDMKVDELLTAMFKATIDVLPVPVGSIDDICVGIANGGNHAIYSRAAALAAGIPEGVALQSISRFCGSGLMAVTAIANQIKGGDIDIGLAVGLESCTEGFKYPEAPFSEEILAHPVASDCQYPMGWTSENVAREFNISRTKMDEYALRSHQRAEKAQAEGRFKDEIVPLVAWKSQIPGGPREQVLVTEDDIIRKGTTAESLAGIRSAFPQWPPSQTTGGNASQTSDGASSVLMMTRRKANSLGLTILGKHVATSLVGLAPRIMGIGPAYAIPKVLKRLGLTKEDVDLFEINEAYSSMYVYCVETLGLDPDKVNVNGGAIALGHPFGATGARQVATGLAELHKRKQKILVTSMCMGYGQGAAAVFVAE